MKKKYLFLMATGTGTWGGAQLFQINYLRLIDYEKYAVTLGVTIDIFSKHLEKYNLPVNLVFIPPYNEKDGFRDKFLKYYKFFKIIKPDCVVFNQFWLRSFSLPEIMAAFLITKGNAYMIVHDCPPDFPKYESKLHFGFIPGIGLGWRKKRLCQTLLGYFTKRTIAVSDASRISLREQYKFPNYNIRQVYHGTDVNINAPSKENRKRLRKELNISDSDIIIVSTAMFFHNKRIDRLVDAFAILAEERDDIHLILVGDGPEYENLTSMVKSFGEDIKRRLRFLGFQEDIPSILQLSDIFVLPSDSEALPLACLESMSCGLITIVTDCGGPREIIEDGYNGFLVERSCEGVTDGLKRALNLCAEEKEQLSYNSREFIKENFNIEKNIRYGLKTLKINTG